MIRFRIENNFPKHQNLYKYFLQAMVIMQNSNENEGRDLMVLKTVVRSMLDSCSKFIKKLLHIISR